MIGLKLFNDVPPTIMELRASVIINQFKSFKMKKLLLTMQCLLVFAILANAVTIGKKTDAAKNETKTTVTGSSKKAAAPAAKKVSRLFKVYPVTVDLSEQCCDGTVHYRFCTTLFGTDIFPPPTSCVEAGNECPICPPQ
jgi:hypothetical protein